MFIGSRDFHRSVVTAPFHLSTPISAEMVDLHVPYVPAKKLVNRLNSHNLGRKLFHLCIFCLKVNAPWYIRNNDLHRDLQVNVVTSEIQSFAQKHEGRLHHHENVEAVQLLDNTCIVRRLQRKKPFELV